MRRPGGDRRLFPLAGAEQRLGQPPLALAGCTRAARTATATAPPASTSPTITSVARPAGWKAVRYRGLSLSVPATWRVRDGRKLPCPAVLLGSAVVLGHSKLQPPCPMTRLRAPLLWIDDRAGEQPPATAVATTINGLAVRLLRVHRATRGQAVSDELLYWSLYPRGSGFSGPGGGARRSRSSCSTRRAARSSTRSWRHCIQPDRRWMNSGLAVLGRPIWSWCQGPERQRCPRPDGTGTRCSRTCSRDRPEAGEIGNCSPR
jgi:hypothetical protein